MSTPQSNQIKHDLRKQGYTLKSWAEANGFKYRDVSDVVRGQRRGHYGIGREIYQALGLKEGDVMEPRDLANAMSSIATAPTFLPLATVNAVIEAQLTGLRRSPEYKAGLAYIVRRKLANIPQEAPPYRDGTAQFDAWHAGTAHGHSLLRDLREAGSTQHG